MATGGTDAKVEGLGEGGMQWVVPFRLLNGSGTEMFSVSATGAVVCASTITASGTQDANGNLTITNTAPFVLLTDSTGSAKSLKIAVDANKAQFREDAGAAGSLLVLDLANNRVGVATASPSVALDVTGAAAISSTLAVTGASTLTGNVTMSGTCVRASQKRLITSDPKVGATAGWVVAGATNVGRMATCPASQSGSTLVVPIHGLKVGDTITAFGLLGQIESAGGTVTLDASLRSLTAAAADLTDASAAAMTQLSVTADTAVTSANAEKASISIAVAADAVYYLLITTTTAGSTDVDLAGAYVVVTES